MTLIYKTIKYEHIQQYVVGRFGEYEWIGKLTAKIKTGNHFKRTTMKRLFRLNFSFQAILLIALTFLGCTNKSTDCTVDFKINGKYEVNFQDSQKALISRNLIQFNRVGQTDIKSIDIQKKKKLKGIQRVDNLTIMSVKLYTKPDSIYKIYNIKSTITIDTIIFNGSHNYFKNDRINHTVSGQTNHEITEIINNKDTLNWFVTTTLDFNLSGQVKGKSYDLLIYNLIEKELSDSYIPEILATIKDKK